MEEKLLLPNNVQERKETPIVTGCLDYFPLALAEISRVSLAGNKQHHPDKPLHWDMSKSTDEANALVRHLIERGTIDTDGIRHTAKVAWRALALLERELRGEDVMPYKSVAQEKFFNANKKKLEKQGVNVQEWNDASKGKKLPKRAPKKKK